MLSPRTVPLHSFVYISAVRDDLAENEIDAMLAGARHHNAAQQLTGVLLQYAGHFVQALEGPGEALRAVGARIVSDPRHREVTVLEEGPLDERRFGEWAMLRMAVHPGDEPGVDAFLRSLVEERRAADVGLLVQMLQALARRH